MPCHENEMIFPIFVSDKKFEDSMDLLLLIKDINHIISTLHSHLNRNRSSISVLRNKKIYLSRKMFFQNTSVETKNIC